MKPLIFRRQDDPSVEILPEEVPGLEATIRVWKHESRSPRDLTGEIESYLATNAGSSMTDIARGIVARDDRVRSILQTDERFQSLPPQPGRSPRRLGWALVRRVSRPVPEAGTSTSDTGSRGS